EDGEQLGRIGVLRVLWHREIVVAQLRRIEWYELGERGPLLLPGYCVLPRAVHDVRDELAGRDAFGLAAADEAGDLARQRGDVLRGLVLAPDVVGEKHVEACGIRRGGDLALPFGLEEVFECRWLEWRQFG